MPTKKNLVPALVEGLRHGASADIWYDARAYGDAINDEAIEHTKQTMEHSADLLEKQFAAIIELSAALAGCVKQIEQMKGMFDDKDGAIQNALDAADTARQQVICWKLMSV